MTTSQEIVLMQLLQKLADQGNHEAIDQLTLSVLHKISDRLDTILDLLVRVHGLVMPAIDAHESAEKLA
jgi:hypothetical protein